MAKQYRMRRYIYISPIPESSSAAIFTYILLDTPERPLGEIAYLSSLFMISIFISSCSREQP